MRADVEEEHAVIAEEEKFDPVFPVDRERPCGRVSAVQFVRFKASVERIDSEQLFFAFRE